MLGLIKKMIIRLILIIVSFIAILYLLLFIFWIIPPHDGYLSGRDTVQSFKNGRYQIIRSSSGSISLHDLKTNIVIESEIRNKEEIDDIIYIIGNNGYCKLDYENEEVKQSKEISDFNDVDQNIFNRIQYIKVPNY